MAAHQLAVLLGEGDQAVAPDQSNGPWVGSTTPHFITFPGVTTENCSARMAGYAGLSRSKGMTAVPMRRPIFSARPRRESGVTFLPESAARAGCGGAEYHRHPGGAHREKDNEVSCGASSA